LKEAEENKEETEKLEDERTDRNNWKKQMDELISGVGKERADL
jgi:hypothetical protein